MKLFVRADTSLIKKTIAIYRDEMIKNNERKPFIIASIFVPLQHFSYTIVPPLLIGFFTESLITNPHNFATPLIILGLLVIVGIIAVVSGHVGFITLFNHEERMNTHLTERSMKGLLAHSHTFFANNKVGALAGDVNTFSRSYTAILDNIFLQASSIIVNFVTSIIVVAFIAPIMVPVLLALTIVIIIQTLHSYAKRGESRKQRKEMMSKIFGSIADVLGNQTLVRMFGRSKDEVKMIVGQRKDLEKITKQEIDILQQGAEVRLVILFVFQIVVLGISLYLISHSLLSIAAFIFIVSYIGRVTSSIFGLNAVIRGMEQSFIDSAKVTEILNITPEIQDAPHAAKLHINNASIDFKNVSFAYEEAREQIVFKDLNLSIKNGQSIGLVGKSGGGKSTLTHLLLRYMDIDNGEILIDNQNIASVTQDSLRDNIAYVPQDPYLFHRSLRDNIAYGKSGASDKEILRAAEQAYATEFIDKLPKGLDTIVGERGVKLSGGQRQRIAIARAILKDAPILLLDEATSALDSESEVYIQRALEKLMEGRTSIVIAHRLSTIARLDRIIVLDKGKIVEDGKHHDLLKNRGIYAKLWGHQSGGFLEE